MEDVAPSVIPAVMVPVVRIRERPDNPNHFDPDKFDRFKQAIRKYGFRQAVNVRPVDDDEEHDYEMEDGHHRLRAAIELGIGEIPAHITADEDDEARAVRISMNNLRGDLDLTAVAHDLDELTEAGWTEEELATTGYSPDELQDLLDIARREADDALSNTAATTAAVEAASAPEEQDTPYALEIEFPSKKERNRARRTLKRLGDGDLARGLQRVLEEE